MVVGAGENITSGNWRESLPVFRLSGFGVHLVSIFDGNQIDFSEMERIDRKREGARIYWVLELSRLPSITSLLKLDPNPCLPALIFLSSFISTTDTIQKTLGVLKIQNVDTKRFLFRSSQRIEPTYYGQAHHRATL